MSRNYRNNNIQKTIKDYAVPLVGLVLILILIFNVFSWDENTTKTENNNQELTNNSIINWVEITKDNAETKAYITYKNEKKVEIEDKVNLWLWEKIEVESWSISIESLDIKARLSQAWELQYKEDWSYFLESGQLWVEALNDIVIYTKYANVKLKTWDVANISQSMVQTDIYAINNNINVTTLYWIDIQLEKWNQLTIKAKDTNSADFNAKENTQKINSYFKLLPWFTQNGWNVLMNEEPKQKSNSWTLEKISIKKIIEFDNLTDESYSKENPLKITWRYDNTKVWEITFNNQKAKLDENLGTFSITINLNNKVNDIVVKVFDKNKNKISKDVYTVYSQSSWQRQNNTISKINADLENYKVDATKFIIYQPSTTGKFTTTSWQITIRWKVLDPRVKAVLVNDYKLKSFNWKTWRYHAFTTQWTLKDWANLYEIKYLDKNWKVIYKEYFSIYKKIKQAPKIKKEKISDEAKLN